MLCKKNSIFLFSVLPLVLPILDLWVQNIFDSSKWKTDPFGVFFLFLEAFGMVLIIFGEKIVKESVFHLLGVFLKTDTQTRNSCFWACFEN